MTCFIDAYELQLVKVQDIQFWLDKTYEDFYTAKNTRSMDDVIYHDTCIKVGFLAGQIRCMLLLHPEFVLTNMAMIEDINVVLNQLLEPS